jgi:uncharacterized membrane protein YkgB
MAKTEANVIEVNNSSFDYSPKVVVSFLYDNGAKQKTTITNECYKYLTGVGSKPFDQKNWHNMNKNQRLSYHLQCMMNDLGATSFTYEVLND